MELLEKYTEELRIKRYSENTINSYVFYFKMFLYYFNGKDYRNISEQEIKDYLLHLITDKNISESYQNNIINAIKFYYLPRPQVPKKIPILLTDEEIVALFGVCKNLKHKSVMALLYGCGLRISEVINIKIENINGKEKLIHIIDSKGKKNRLVPVSESVLGLLREYYKKDKPQTFLFNGQTTNGNPNLQYSEASIRSLLKDYASMAGIQKKVNPHLLRHNYATEQIEENINLLNLQAILGHSSPKTTGIYFNYRRNGFKNVNSPIDKINLLGK